MIKREFVMTYDFLNKLTWEQKQLFASKCFKTYCEYFCIKDDSINKLLEHLNSMEKYKNQYHDLATWERNGADLELTGRGDPLSQILLEKIPNEKLIEFKNILTYTVEVGLCDMYGANTNEPYEYLIKIIKILEKNKIELLQ
jgi:hypothetical protein